VFGRSAMGETVNDGRIFDRWRVRVGGTLAFAETIRIDGAIAQRLRRRAVAHDGVAIATVLKLPGGAADVAAVRAAQDRFLGEAGASTWNGLMAARLLARDGAALRHDLVAVLKALRIASPRLWMN